MFVVVKSNYEHDLINNKYNYTVFKPNLNSWKNVKKAGIMNAAEDLKLMSLLKMCIRDSGRDVDLYSIHVLLEIYTYV